MARLSILLLLLTGTSLSAQIDTVFFCNPGQQIQLNTLPGQFAYEWSPVQGLNDPTIDNPIARPVETTLYVVQVIGEGTGDNLITNPDFTDGNTGVISDYSFVSSISTQGVYGVNASAANLNRISFDDCPDHTSGTGQMMVVDGSPVANERVWCQTITVETEANYAFSTWLTSVNPINPARLQFSINGRRFGGIFTAGETVCDWRQFYAVWNAATATEAEICIVNQNTNPQGNDFALDDFAFFKIPAIIMDSTLVLLPETTHSSSVVRKPDCGTSNGAVAISSTSDGPNQFVYSLDGGPFLPDTVFQGLITGTHTIAIRNDHPSLAGETCIEELEVFLPQGDCPFYLPSVFSPNSDGINDVFRVFTANGFTGRLLSFTIHDRWGGLVFTGNGADPLTTGWDGRVRGISAANGTYLYQVKLENDEGEVTERNGTVVLVR